MLIIFILIKIKDMNDIIVKFSNSKVNIYIFSKKVQLGLQIDSNISVFDINKI